MYPLIPWEMAAYPLGSAQHALGTAIRKMFMLHWLFTCMAQRARKD